MNHIWPPIPDKLQPDLGYILGGFARNIHSSSYTKPCSVCTIITLPKRPLELPPRLDTVQDVSVQQPKGCVKLYGLYVGSEVLTIS